MFGLWFGLWYCLDPTTCYHFLWSSFYFFFDSSRDSISKSSVHISLHILPILPISIKNCIAIANRPLFRTNNYIEMLWLLKSLSSASFWLKFLHVVWNKLYFLTKYIFILFKLLAPDFFFLNLTQPVYKMWIIQEPNTLELWNKLHFEKEKTEIIHHV